MANFVNNELYGKITNYKFAIIYPEIDFQPRHPSQLYEAFFEGIVIFVILITYFYKNKSNIAVGKITGLFILLYALFRFFIEYLREPDAHIGLLFNFISLGQILTIPLFFVGIIIFKYDDSKKRTYK